MNGKIIAINRNLGVIVVETQTHRCVVLEATGLLAFTVGEQVDGDFEQLGDIQLHNLSTGDKVHARVQTTNVSNGDAIGTMSVF